MRKTLVGILWGFAVVMILGGKVAAGSRFELGAGIASPVGNLQDNWNTGLGLNGAFLMEITPFVSGGFSASYSTMGFDVDAFKAEAADPEHFIASGGDISIMSFCGELRGQTGAMDKALFYGGAGIGLYLVSIADITAGYTDDMETVTFDRKSRFGGFVNAGFAIPVSPIIGLGARAQYNIYWTHEGGGESGIAGGSNETSSFLAVQAMGTISLGG
jgi:hypothetical protein